MRNITSGTKNKTKLLKKAIKSVSSGALKTLATERITDNIAVKETATKKNKLNLLAFLSASIYTES